MRNHWKAALAGLSLGLGFGLAGPASAQEWNVETYFGYLSVGTAHLIGPGHVYWLGEFSGTATDNGAGTIFDNMALKCPAWLDLDFANNVALGGGYCVATLTNGDMFVISWSCERTLQGTGEGLFPFGRDDTCDGPSEVVTGTGTLAGLTGGNMFQAQTVATHPDGKGSGYALQQWTLIAR